MNCFIVEACLLKEEKMSAGNDMQSRFEVGSSSAAIRTGFVRGRNELVGAAIRDCEIPQSPARIESAGRMTCGAFFRRELRAGDRLAAPRVDAASGVRLSPTSYENPGYHLIGMIYRPFWCRNGATLPRERRKSLKNFSVYGIRNRLPRRQSAANGGTQAWYARRIAAAPHGMNFACDTPVRRPRRQQ